MVNLSACSLRSGGICLKFASRFILMKSLPIALALGAPSAYAEMWKCVEADGTTRYTNVKADAKGCKSLNLEPEHAAPPSSRAPAKTANFPSVDGNTQKQRDAERRLLLERELGDEQRELDLSRKELGEQKAQRPPKNTGAADQSAKRYEDKVRRHEMNIESLKKELANIK
jgi:hypothetical protein